MSKTLTSAEALQTELDVMKRTTGLPRAQERDAQMLIDRATSAEGAARAAYLAAARHILAGMS